jgi:F0F1-type ATP synthase delta subunit
VARHERALERTIAECDAAAALLDLQSPYRTLFSRILRGHICGVEELRESNVFQPFFVKFLQLVATNGRLRLFKDIARLFATLANQALNRVALTVYTAEPIPSKYTSVIEDKLAKIFTNTLSITYKTDPRILGGLVVQSDSLTIDASVKHQIEKFSKEALAYVI